MTTRKQAASDSDTRLEQLESLIEDLQRRVNSQPPPQSTSSEPKISSPDTFDGKDPTQLPDFLLQVNLAFDLQPSRYASEPVKVKYAVTRALNGPARPGGPSGGPGSGHPEARPDPTFESSTLHLELSTG